ncbi:hypothetical protein [Natrarchaeobaculum sulfurireducens]|uniref:hypothetical protein n=1 Tax=Natrarchaeobaculum sulfurireducens TaxID=2044521 RepID=UPI000E3BAFB6|nr:hypothetical protein [Natrarchaeobaculum sulfurireducens]
MTRDTSESDTSEAGRLPNLVTIVGRGVPSNFEISVAGELEMLADDPFEEGTVVTKSAVEGSIDTGVQRFRFSGELANISVVDWNGVEGAASPSTPTVHVNYGVQNQ